ncbi:MAG TPA: glycerol-3-phosphate dehydrogenase/oxidase [Bdellovibrionales bacterium]|nr:glycerol-3-phosphate dehydrogenase/oxidase [Bdellovibrionales bacterium]
MASTTAKHSSFSVKDRQPLIDRMTTEEFDLVIIGGGITGAGAARDAASRGMKVALIEAKDFAIGTSSRSSKLIHGGIRYLENLEFGLVFEALSERRLLFEIAPHLVHPLRFVLPLYKGGRVGMFKMGLGMWLYDALSMFEAPELNERLSPHESLERLPLLQNRDLLGSYVYSDAYMDDDRLVLETLRSANELGALCVNHVSADDAQFTDGKVQSIGCTDRLTNKKFKIKAKHFVSTVGPWTDSVASNLLGQWKKILRPSKGVHLTFDRKRLQLNQAVVMVSDDQKRIVFGIPRHEMIIIGTTDTDYQGDPYDVGANASDVKYLLHVASEYFPGAKLTASDIIATYAGVRPLVDDGSASESKTSREHVIIRDPRNVTFVAGGKYTTYRRMAEHTVDTALLNFTSEEQVRFSRSNTKVPLNPLATIAKMDESRLSVEDWSREFRMPESAVDLLVDRHGGEAVKLLENEATGSHKPATVDERIWEIEARHAIHQTMCFGLIDFYVRRSPLFLARKDHGLSLIAHLSRVFADEFSWSDSRRQEEAARLQAYIRHELSWREAFDL